MSTPKSIKGRILILGWYQLIGGIIGIGLSLSILFGILSQGHGSKGTLLLLLLINIPFLFSIYAGYVCIYNHTNKFLVTKINQALQVVSFSIAGMAFSYHSGVFFNIGIETTKEAFFNFELGLSTFNLEIQTDSDNYIVYLNIVAIYLLFKTMKYENLAEEAGERMANSEYLDDDMVS